MNSIIKDIQDNCPNCECSIEQTVRFLSIRGDLHFTSNHYREVWNFYNEMLVEFKYNKRKARETTMELYKIKLDKFKYIQKWAKRVIVIT